MAGTAIGSCGGQATPGSGAGDAVPTGAAELNHRSAVDSTDAVRATLVFAFDGGVSLELPVTVCTGVGSVLTIMARADGTQVDVRIIDSAQLRGGAPIETATVTTFRTTGERAGRRFEEVWRSTGNRVVRRDGDSIRIAGQMSGQRMYATAEATYLSPRSIPGDREYSLTLRAKCAS